MEMTAQLMPQKHKNIIQQTEPRSTKKAEGMASFIETLESFNQGEGDLSNNKELQDLLSSIKKMMEELNISLDEGTVDLSADQVTSIISKLDPSKASMWMEEGVPEELQVLLQMDESQFKKLNESDQSELMTKLESIGDNLGAGEKNITEVQKSIHQLLQSTTGMNHLEDVKTSENQSVLSQLKEMWSKFDKVSTQLIDQKQPNGAIRPELLDQKMTGQLKQILEQVTRLAGKSKDGESFQEKITQLSRQGSNEQQQLFAHLVKNYSDRKSMPFSYQQQSTVRNKDIALWAAQPMTRNSNTEQMGAAQSGSLQTSMSKVEQFVIHMNKNQPQSMMSNQFMEQFEQLVKSSRMFQKGSGQAEMNLRLKPQQLGDMNVKLMQMNGEMTVKITVTTQAAKEMLESNMNQLRHMFSPQQVAVEKGEMNAGDQFESQEEKGTGEFKDQGSSHQHKGDEEKESSSEESSLTFKELLVNEKV
ncbi:flagellar hook-length control protein FliK [Halobacillus sp. A5]|uniref:flagellar hook-length control protein FliK n=1 Tax=Halobacillus sp. A5 TaxID=2880263 RepID=UPI0020A6A396|nr:flagellar hook-length control protein FliK [Halobacillus sp. A5]MCP3026119.1 flagellar hook-length control protein FliK [Halobacillus sp. A5]